MTVCFYSPYLPDHFGGGERHLFDIARVVAKTHSVYIAIAGNATVAELAAIKQRYETFLAYSLAELTFITTPIPHESALTKLLWTHQFDYLYVVTDGSLFFSLAKHNHLHIQIPFTNTQAGLLNAAKLHAWKTKNTNSEFTKRHIEKNWHTTITHVIHPLVDPACFASQNQKKEKIILNVGRFFKQLHSKRQDALVTFFTHLCEQEPEALTNWKLILIGTAEDPEYVDAVKKQAKNLPIEIFHDVSREKLIEYYKKASIYWHATGYQVDAEKHPEKMEHFGMTTVEAMAARAVPIVINAGGQPEILGKNLAPLLWQTETECLNTTLKCIQNAAYLHEYQEKAQERAHNFGQDRFEQEVSDCFNQHGKKRA